MSERVSNKQKNERNSNAIRGFILIFFNTVAYFDIFHNKSLKNNTQPRPVMGSVRWILSLFAEGQELLEVWVLRLLYKVVPPYLWGDMFQDP